MHAHVCAKLSTDPGICNLMMKTAVGWLAAEKHQSDPDVLVQYGAIQQQIIQKERLLKLAKDEFID